jgi:hypothetical protein
MRSFCGCRSLGGHRLVWLCAVSWGLAMITAVPLTAARGEDWDARRQTLDAAFHARLEALAARCDELGLQREAESTRGWPIPRNPRRMVVFLPPPLMPGPPGDESPPAAGYWFQHFMDARRDYADQLYALAQASARERPAWAYQLAHEVLREYPDHEAARSAIGYRRFEGRWMYGGDRIRSSVGRTALKEYGLAARRYNLIDSANFHIITDADPQAGEQLARRLEDLYSVWRQLFFKYWSDGETLARRLESGAPDARPRSARHMIVWFQTRDQYLSVLRPGEPLIDKTLGIYVDKRKTVFLYGDSEEMMSSWLHEVTHQLFAENGRTASDVGRHGNVWIVEGIAMYLESASWAEDVCLLGGIDAKRLQNARYRLLQEKFHVPLAELVLLDRQRMQQDPRLGALYSQSAGLAHFLMHAETGRYREATSEYLAAVYRGAAAPTELAERTQMPLDELDRRYHAYLQVLDDDLADCQAVADLYLGHTLISDDGLVQVPTRNLEWLDVSFTRIGDRGLVNLPQATRLRQLSLERTQVTGAGLQSLRALQRLEYLDLSGLQIDDAALAELAGLERLESLWLTETRISDAGLEHLLGLKRLKKLDVSGTQVTADGLARLKARLPLLQGSP